MDGNGVFRKSCQASYAWPTLAQFVVICVGNESLYWWMKLRSIYGLVTFEFPKHRHNRHFICKVLKYAQTLGQALSQPLIEATYERRPSRYTSEEGSFPRWLYLSWRLICVAKDSWHPCTSKVEALGTPHRLEILISNGLKLGINIRGPKFNLSESMRGLINHKPIGVGLSIDFLSWLPRVLSLLAYVCTHTHAYMKFLMIGWLGFRPSIQKVTMDQTIVKLVSLVILIRCWGSLG